MTMGNVIHAYGRCEGCDWTDTSLDARTNAEKHSEKTGHKTVVEVMRLFTYG